MNNTRPMHTGPVGKQRLTNSQRRKMIRIGRVAAHVDYLTEVEDKEHPSDEMYKEASAEYLMPALRAGASMYQTAVFSIFGVMQIKLNSLALGQEYSIIQNIAAKLPPHVFEQFMIGYKQYKPDED